MENVILIEDLLNEDGAIDVNVANDISSPLMRWLIHSGAVTGIMTAPVGKSPDGTLLQARTWKSRPDGTPKDMAVAVRDEFLKLKEEGRQVYLYNIKYEPSTFVYGVSDPDTFVVTYTSDIDLTIPYIYYRCAIV